MDNREELLKNLTVLVCLYCKAAFRVLRVPKKKKVFCSEACQQLQVMNKGTHASFKWKSKKEPDSDE